MAAKKKARKVKPAKRGAKKSNVQGFGGRKSTGGKGS